MHRTQVQLDEEQMRALRAEAARSGVSVAALIREAVDVYLSRSESVRTRALAVAGRFASGQHDVAEQHDRELESYYAEA
ncbi:MAG TPA: ribbon-helix-helix protein, CopG family [Candidatus Acetothermia bacterium]|nr:ribbon-helix-helix protein, CopG family [Candidatus Acetothermia bacterium]